MTFDGRQPLMEDNLWLKTTFDGIWHLIDEEIWWKTTFDKEDALLWTTTFNWRCPLMEGNLKPWDFLTAAFSVTVWAVVRCSYTGCDSTIELLHYDLEWLKNGTNTQQGLHRTRKLQQCTNLKGNLWICELAKASNKNNWSVQQVCKAGPSSGSVKLVRSAGLFSWSD